MKLYSLSNIIKILAVSSLLTISLMYSACDSAPPEEPSEIKSTNNVNQNTNSNVQDTSNSANAVAKTNTDTSTVKSGITEKTNFDPGGADVGDAEMKKSVETCHEDQMFYNRNLLKCSDEIKLAGVDCTKTGILSALGTSQAEQFGTILKGDTLADYEMDQCVKCTAGMTDSDDVCKNKNGQAQEGVKIFFVKEQNSQILIQSVIIPN